MSDSTETVNRLTDAALVAALRSDDPAAKDLLLDRYGEFVQRILYRILGADPELQDVLHDVFIAALTSLARLRDDSALRGWLTGIAIHKAKKLVRRRQRWRWIESMAPCDLPDTAAPTPSPDVLQALVHALRIMDRLPFEERVAFALRRIDGMALSTIAAATRVSLATTKRRIFRAQTRVAELSNENALLRPWLGRGTRESQDRVSRSRRVRGP